jgi:ribosomal protein L37AE/L43A
VLWLAAERRRSRREASVRARFVSCRLCGNAFEARREQGVVCTCPKCGVLNGVEGQ